MLVSVIKYYSNKFNKWKKICGKKPASTDVNSRSVSRANSLQMNDLNKLALVLINFD